MIKWHEVPVLRPGFNGFGEIDPYIDWSFGTGRSKLFVESERSRFPLLLRLQDGLSASEFSTGAIFGQGEKPSDWKENVRVPPIYLRNGDAFGGCSYFTTFVTKRFFKYFSEQDWGDKLVRAIARMAVSGNLRDHTFPVDDPAAETGQQSPVGNAENGTVVIGVIDDGIAFANERFRTADNRSRVEHIWLQDGTYKTTAARYGYGCSLSKCDTSGGEGIDTLLSRSTYSGLVDEDEVYARAGAIAFGGEGPSKLWVLKTGALRASHGTHVMDIACGYAPGTAPKNESTRGEDSRPIVCVQLPAASSEGTSGASLDTFAVDGVRYILDKADEIARNRGCGRLPVVINFSFGTIAGRHDGTSDIERAIDELIGARQGTPAPVQVVMPAGNSRLKRCHAQVSFERKSCLFRRGSVKCLYWRILPDDRTTSHLEIWLPRGAPAGRIKVSVKPPFGEASPPVKENVRPVRVWGETVDEGLCEVRYCHLPEPTNRGMFLITLKPTTPVEDPATRQLDLAVAPAGVWTIQLENMSFGPEQVVEAWIQRDDTRYGYPTLGRQSYFDHAEYVSIGKNGKVPQRDEPQSAVRRTGTLNPIATGRHTIVIEGFRRKDFLPADYSGEGLVASRMGPDALAVSDDSIVHSGLLASGTRSGSVIALTGTSLAVPQVTRLVACRLAEGKPADRAAIRAFAEAEEVANPRRPGPLPEQRVGKGRIELAPIVSVQRVDERG